MRFFCRPKIKNQTKMQNQFSSALIAKCQKVIFQKSGKKISKAKAELYLEKFARYFMLAVKVLDQETETNKLKQKSHGKNYSN
jgi:hypothetical protein